MLIFTPAPRFSEREEVGGGQRIETINHREEEEVEERKDKYERMRLWGRGER